LTFRWVYVTPEIMNLKVRTLIMFQEAPGYGIKAV